MIDSVPTLVSALGSLLLYFQAERFHKEIGLKEALVAIQEAITETMKYIERENNNERDREEELDLSKLWGVAAILIRQYNPGFAKKLRIKSTYWENSANLSRREIHQYGIALSIYPKNS